MPCMRCPITTVLEYVKTTHIKSIIHAVFNETRCPQNHTTLYCKLCGENFISVLAAMTHYVWCSNKIDKFEFARSITLGVINNKNIFINVEDIYNIIPYFFVLKIDYDKILSVFIIENINNFRFPYGTLFGKLLDDAVKIIMKHDVSCSMCGKYYETFPTLEMVNKHFTAHSDMFFNRSAELVNSSRGANQVG